MLIRNHIKEKNKTVERETNLEKIKTTDREKEIIKRKKNKNPEPFMAPSKLGALR